MTGLWTALASLVQYILGRIFPTLAKVDPVAEAQGQRDRADVLQKELDDVKSAEGIRDTVAVTPGDKLRDDPGNLYRD